MSQETHPEATTAKEWTDETGRNWRVRRWRDSGGLFIETQHNTQNLPPVRSFLLGEQESEVCRSMQVALRYVDNPHYSGLTIEW